MNNKLKFIFIAGGCSVLFVGFYSHNLINNAGIEERIAEELKKNNVTISYTAKSQIIAMVAGGPTEDIYPKVVAFCKSENIPFVASCGLGSFGLYVSVEDFYKIQKKLIGLKKEQNLDKLEIYGIKATN